MTDVVKKAWWRRIQWVDVVLVVLRVVVLLFLTMEIWMPHFGPD